MLVGELLRKHHTTLIHRQCSPYHLSDSVNLWLVPEKSEIGIQGKKESSLRNYITCNFTV